MIHVYIFHISILRYDETRKELMATTAADFDAIDKNELIVRYMTLKQRIQTQSSQNAELKDKIQKQQVTIIAQNERAEKFEEVKKAHVSQAKHMHRLQVIIIIKSYMKNTNNFIRHFLEVRECFLISDW